MSLSSLSLRKEEDLVLRQLFDNLSDDKKIYAETFISTRNPLIACQACCGKSDEATLYLYICDEDIQVYVTEKIKTLMPKAMDEWQEADKLISYKDKVKYLVDCLSELKNSDESDYSSIVKIISELNKMQGHYAPTKNLTVTAVLTAEELSQFEDLLKKYEREF